MNLADQSSRNLRMFYPGLMTDAIRGSAELFFLPDLFPLTIPTLKSAFIYMRDRPVDDAVKLACLSPHNVTN